MNVIVKNNAFCNISTLENVDTLEDVRLNDFDDLELYAHWVDAKKAQEAKASGRPVIALCGKVWRPTKNPDGYPTCPKCQEIYNKVVE